MRGEWNVRMITRTTMMMMEIEFCCGCLLASQFHHQVADASEDNLTVTTDDAESNCYVQMNLLFAIVINPRTVI